MEMSLFNKGITSKVQIVVSRIFKKNFLGALWFFSCIIPGPLEAQSISMVLIKGGTFWQGSNEAPYSSNEQAHKTTLRSYYISSTEITQAQWLDVMGNNPSKFSGKDRPVEYVSWYDAVKFCNALSLKEGLTPVYTISGSTVDWNKTAGGYRLPTEAEWEYAARGGQFGAIDDEPLVRAPYAGSEDANTVGWYEKNSNKSTKPVGQKAPNQVGLYDMSGNVWEWCWDWYGTYPKEAVENPDGANRQSGQKVLRGGSWFTPEKLLRVTYRYWNVPTFKVNSVGFRVARNADEIETSEETELSLPDGLNIYEALSPPAKNESALKTNSF